MGCLDTIELKPKPGVEEAIIIDGRLVYGDTSEITVSVMSLFNFQANQTTPFPVEYVRCYNSLGQQIDLLMEELGTYRASILPTMSNFEVKVGVSYHVEIKSSQDVIFQSRPDELTSIIAGELTVEKTAKKILNQIGTYDDVPFLAFSINMPLEVGSNLKNNRFKFRFERAFRFTDNTEKTCYVFQEFDIPNLVLFEAKKLDSNLSEILIPLSEFKIDYYFAEGYYLNLFQESLSEEAFSFWQNVQTLTVRTGNQFEVPVGKAGTNFFSNNSSDQIFGYFYCTSEVLSQIYISPEAAGNPLRLCPGTPFECEDCLFFPRSQLSKPSFWIE